MAIESREVVMYVRKATVSSIRVSYRSIRARPYSWGMLFFILLLSRAFPLLFSFLVSSSPVIVCTAILLGTLLSYGTPNFPEIEEEDKKTQKISSMQTDSAVDGIFVRKDESFAVDTHLEATKEAAATGTSNSTSDEIGCDVPFAKIYDLGYGSNNTILTTRSLLNGETKEMHSEMKVMKEREVAEREFSVSSQNEVEGLTIQVAKIASDSPFDSSLGSPWQHVDNFDPSSGSDSDDAESSSPDASMADIIPMLNELDPLLKSEHSHTTLSSNENSDSSSSGSSHDHEPEEAENKGNEIEEPQEKDDPNEVAVAWNENDQNNVMDLGYSEIERNRRLENLIARRRLRKLQRYVTEKNLIDLDSLYPTSIPSISAPRWNPFDVHCDYGGNLNLPPIPGSAPSVMQPRKNPFDLSCDQVEEVNAMSREYLSHHEFMSAAQGDVLSRWHESSTVGLGPSLLGDFSQENEDPKLIGSELHQRSTMLLSPVSHDVDHVEQYKQSSGAIVSVDNDHAVDFNTSVSIEETHPSAHSLGVMEGEIGDGENILLVSETQKLEVGEERYGDSSNSSSSEADEKSSRVDDYEESANLEEKSCDSVQLKPGDDASASNPVYDSSLSAMEENISNISTHDETFIHDCTENVISNSLSSDVQADFALVSLPQSPSEADVSIEDQDLVVVGRKEDLALGIVEMSESSRDVPPIAAMPESDDEKLTHSSCLSSTDSKSNEECVADADKHVQSEGNEMISDLPSIDESAMHLLPEAHSENSRIRSLDWLSTSEENLVVDHKSVLQSPTNSDSAVLQVVEESNVYMLNVEQGTSTFLMAAKEIGQDDLAMGLVPEEKSGDTLVEPLIIPAHDDKFPKSDLAESMEFSNISDMTLKHEMGTIDDLGDSQRTITNDTFSKNESGFLRNSSNPYEELDDDVHGEVSRVTDIDEGLLSELDVVGDFRAEREIKSEQEGSSQEVGKLDTIVEDSFAELHDSRVLPMKYDGFPIGEDPELTVYNSKLHVLEACSLEELDSVFKQHRDESAVPSTSDLVTSESEVVPSELGSANKNQEITETDPEMLVLEAKSVEEISAALKQPSEGLDKPDTCKVETLEVLSEMTHLEAEETISDLHVIEAKSLEDINLALKQQSEVFVESHQGEMKHEKVLTEIVASKIELEAEAVEVQSSEARERNLEPEHPVVKSAKEIKLGTVVEDSCAELHDSRVLPTKYDGFPIGEDPELTVYNSKLHVLEACSLEELDSVFKQHRDESAVPSTSDLTVEDSVTSESEMVPSELGSANKNREITETDMEMLVFEAITVEDISSALKKPSEGLDKPDMSKVETLEVVPEMTYLKAEETTSDLHVVEAKSLEDINLALKQLSEVMVENHQGETKCENVLTEIMASKLELEPEAVKMQSSEARERNLEPEHPVVKPAEEIKLDSVTQSSEIADGSENAVNVSSASTSKKVRKKKPDNSSSVSGSSSSSSSSSSDSE